MDCRRRQRSGRILVDVKNLGYRTYFTDIKLLWAEIQELTGEIPQLPQLSVRIQQLALSSGYQFYRA